MIDARARVGHRRAAEHGEALCRPERRRGLRRRQERRHRRARRIPARTDTPHAPALHGRSSLLAVSRSRRYSTARGPARLFHFETVSADVPCSYCRARMNGTRAARALFRRFRGVRRNVRASRRSRSRPSLSRPFGAPARRSCRRSRTHFPGAGLTCVLILAESHAVLHTWPETGTVNIDIFSCSTRLKSLAAIAELGRSFGAQRCRSRKSLVLTDTSRAPTSAARYVAARRGREPRHLRPAPAALDRSARRAAIHPPAGRTAARRCSARPTLPVEATLACSGADAMALCLGAVLAYPVTLARGVWPARRRRSLCIVVLNTVRIGTLGRAAASPSGSTLCTSIVWPAVLTLAIAGYVLHWMRLADRRHGRRTTARPGTRIRRSARVPRPSRRFVVLTAAFVVVFLAASPLFLASAARFRAGRLHRPRGRGRPRCGRRHARTPQPTCCGRRAAASSSRRSASPHR